MVLPIVIFICVALLVQLSQVASDVYMMQQLQAEIDRQFSVDMNIARCMRVLSQSMLYSGIDSVGGMSNLDGMVFFPLENMYQCRFVQDQSMFAVDSTDHMYTFNLQLFSAEQGVDHTAYVRQIQIRVDSQLGTMINFLIKN